MIMLRGRMRSELLIRRVVAAASSGRRGGGRRAGCACLSSSSSSDGGSLVASLRVRGSVADAIATSLLERTIPTIVERETSTRGTMATDDIIQGSPMRSWDTNVVVAFFPDGWNESAAEAAVKQACADSGIMDAALPGIIMRPLHATPYARWREDAEAAMEPITVSDDILVVPARADDPATTATPPATAPSALTIRIAPGMAFGTGAHETTAMMLARMWRHREAMTNARLCDWGTGSGILAIAGVLLGASRVLATDVDADAIQSAHANALLNALDADIGPDFTFARGGEGETRNHPTPPTPHAVRGAPGHVRFSCVKHDALVAESKNGGSGVARMEKSQDVIVANILASPLIDLAPAFQGMLAPGGRLLLSGVMQGDQSRRVIAAYDDPAAWEAPMEVSPPRPKRPKRPKACLLWDLFVGPHLLTLLSLSFSSSLSLYCAAGCGHAGRLGGARGDPKRRLVMSGPYRAF